MRKEEGGDEDRKEMELGVGQVLQSIMSWEPQEGPWQRRDRM